MYEQQRPTDDKRAAARAHLNACHWLLPSEENSRQLNEQPISKEIKFKLARAANTVPGSNGVEYRHLRSLDPRGLVLDLMFSTVWRIGIPSCWKKSRTHPDFLESAHRRLQQLPPNLLTAYDVQDFFGDHQRPARQHDKGIGMVRALTKGLFAGR